jgi:hypothetical protein
MADEAGTKVTLPRGLSASGLESLGISRNGTDTAAPVSDTSEAPAKSATPVAAESDTPTKDSPPAPEAAASSTEPVTESAAEPKADAPAADTSGADPAKPQDDGGLTSDQAEWRKTEEERLTRHFQSVSDKRFADWEKKQDSKRLEAESAAERQRNDAVVKQQQADDERLYDDDPVKYAEVKHGRDQEARSKEQWEASEAPRIQRSASEAIYGAIGARMNEIPEMQDLADNEREQLAPEAFEGSDDAFSAWVSKAADIISAKRMATQLPEMVEKEAAKRAEAIVAADRTSNRAAQQADTTSPDVSTGGLSGEPEPMPLDDVVRLLGGRNRRDAASSWRDNKDNIIAALKSQGRGVRTNA